MHDANDDSDITIMISVGWDAKHMCTRAVFPTLTPDVFACLNDAVQRANQVRTAKSFLDGDANATACAVPTRGKAKSSSQAKSDRLRVIHKSSTIVDIAFLVLWPALAGAR